MVLRNPTPSELNLLKFLIDKADVSVIPKNWSMRLLVDEMDDGGMGSLQLFPEGIKNMNRKFGKQISDCQFTDEDGVEVIASLYIDQFGFLYELDIWKTNFEKLMHIPMDTKKLRKLQK